MHLTTTNNTSVESTLDIALEMKSPSLCCTPSHVSAGLPRSCGETVSNAWRDVVSTFSQPFSLIIGILIQGIWKEG